MLICLEPSLFHPPVRIDEMLTNIDREPYKDFYPGTQEKRACDKFVGKKSAGCPGLPEFFPTAAELAASQRNYVIGAPNRPMHA